MKRATVAKMPSAPSSNRAVLANLTSLLVASGFVVRSLIASLSLAMPASSVHGRIGYLKFLDCPQSDCSVQNDQASMREAQVMLG